MKKKKRGLFYALNLLLSLLLVFSCTNDFSDQKSNPSNDSLSKINGKTLAGAYNYLDNVAPSQNPPGGIHPSEAPMFIVLGFDDNNIAAGMKWVIDEFAGKVNPAGEGNAATYDGAPINATFYHSSTNLSAWAVKPQWRDAILKGFELGNHTDTHPGGRRFSSAQWEAEMRACNDKLAQPYDTGIGADVSKIVGFRAPFLEYNTNTFPAIKKMGLIYDCSIEEGWDPAHDGTNFLWPYTLNNGSPGNRSHNARYPEIPLINPCAGVWELPVYTVIVPPDNECANYGVSAGLRAKYEATKGQKFSAADGKITGFDWNLWHDFQMSSDEFAATLKYTLDLRLKGNRAPLFFGTHSNYYNDSVRQTGLREFIRYALTKKDVRIVSAKQFLDWMRNPVPLTKTPDTKAPTVPGNPAIVNITWKEAMLTWNESVDDRNYVIYSVYLNGKLHGKTEKLSYSFPLLTDSTAYTAYVIASDRTGNSSLPSAEVSFVTLVKPVDNTPPTVPTGLSGKAESKTSISINWNPSTDDFEMAGYRVYVDGIKKIELVGTSTLLNNLVADTNYSIQVSAFDKTGNESAKSEPVIIKTQGDVVPDPNATGVPGRPSLSKNVWNGESSYTVTMNMWWGNNGTQVKLYENGTLVEIKNVQPNSPSAQRVKFSFAGKAKGKYVYKCELINQFGTTASSELNITVTR